MSIQVGTSHFVSIPAAFKYYKEYGYSEMDVRDKVIAKEITIGQPEIIFGESLKVDTNGRYMIIKKVYE
jgi:hypothetical protein